MANMKQLGETIYDWAIGQGFYNRELDSAGQPNPCFASEKIALIGSEASEILEATRKNDSENEAEECADVMIRVMEYAVWRGFDLDKEVAKKMEKNMGRPYLHGKVF